MKRIKNRSTFQHEYRIVKDNPEFIVISVYLIIARMSSHLFVQLLTRAKLSRIFDKHCHCFIRYSRDESISMFVDKT